MSPDMLIDYILYSAIQHLMSWKGKRLEAEKSISKLIWWFTQKRMRNRKDYGSGNNLSGEGKMGNCDFDK